MISLSLSFYRQRVEGREGTRARSCPQPTLPNPAARVRAQEDAAASLRSQGLARTARGGQRRRRSGELLTELLLIIRSLKLERPRATGTAHDARDAVASKIQQVRELVGQTLDLFKLRLTYSHIVVK